jgi:predicted dehydrogenase
MRPRIGLIGVGNIGTAHRRAIAFCVKRGLVDAEITAVCDADPARRESAAAKSGARLATADPAELIGSSDVNTVYICTPTASHRELALATLAAGKALFCEKPLAFNGADAAEMRDAARRAGVTHQVGLVLRFSPVISVTRELIRDGALGRPMTAVLVDDQFFPIQGHYNSTWRADVTLAGAGTLLEHAIHDIDVLVTCFGPVRRVFGVTRAFFENPGVEDVSSSVLEFEDGTVASHVSIWHNLLSRGSSRRLHVICTDGQVSWIDNDWSGPIRVETNSAPAHELSCAEVVRRFAEAERVPAGMLPLMGPEHNGMDYTLENYRFLTAVVEDRPADLDFDAAVYAHRVVDAIYASARSGQPVEP